LAHLNKVMRSFNLEGASRCVDVFLRPDGSFGFEEYRRDIEDEAGWFPIGGHALRSFATVDEAMTHARYAVTWLDELDI
jgi:hypothetical protein